MNSIKEIEIFKDLILKDKEFIDQLSKKVQEINDKKKNEKEEAIIKARINSSNVLR